MNEEIKRELRANQIPQWRLAQKIGVSEQTLIRWLRERLSAERKEKIEKALVDLLREVNIS